MPPDAQNPTRRRLRWPYVALAYGCVGIGAIGVVVPGLPTTPFLLLAVWAASRGSERLHRWLYSHRHFGPLLRLWQEQGAVPRRAKWVAVLLMLLSWLVLVRYSDGVAVPLVVGIVLSTVAVFLCTRPSPRKLYEETDSDGA